ncbi:MAG: type I DNA topoisomerase [Candidatus Omnitrophica bacterium]|nr:type I DNA topoisomerase [Candidatus Omnitrophota bacterium]
MSKALVIVESPAKVKTINKILGAKYKVTSSMGHLIDLPKSTIGVDVDHDFEPKLIVVRAKQKVLGKLKKEAEGKTEIYFATDPDREGEAIGWNLVPYLAKDKKIFRVVFHEITKEAVLKAFKEKHQFDTQKINAQNARRILDRIVGYMLSPVLWKKVGSRLSAGRVQSVALRLIVDRERSIQKFIPVEYWQIAVLLNKDGISDALEAQLEKIDGVKADLKTADEANAIAKELSEKLFRVTAVTTREVKRNALPPFITSTLQQEAFSKLGFNAQRTMMIAQELYEGVEIGEEDPVGLITYMRTDSVNISNEAMGKVRDLIADKYGKTYLPEVPNKYKSKKQAQEAHEAIRPSDVYRTPESIKQYLSEDLYKLYDLIWKRFISCQMTPALFENKKVEITAGDKYQFGASGSTLVFPGCLSVYKTSEDEEKKQDLAPYFEKDILKMTEIKPTQHFTKAPARFSEASLVKALEEEGIGRPSTYASIIQTLVLRNYVTRDRGYFTPTQLGCLICDLLVANFPKVMDISFTAQMEERLDMVEEGTLDHVTLLREFYGPFRAELDAAMGSIEKSNIAFDKPCPVCAGEMLVKWGRNGRFVSCAAFPKCRHAEPFPTGVKCPEENCPGELVERRNHRGGVFYGCNKYPDCKHISNKLPAPAAK